MFLKLNRTVCAFWSLLVIPKGSTLSFCLVFIRQPHMGITNLRAKFIKKFVIVCVIAMNNVEWLWHFWMLFFFIFFAVLWILNLLNEDSNVTLITEIFDERFHMNMQGEKPITKWKTMALGGSHWFEYTTHFDLKDSHSIERIIQIRYEWIRGKHMTQIEMMLWRAPYSVAKRLHNDWIRNVQRGGFSVAFPNYSISKSRHSNEVMCNLKQTYGESIFVWHLYKCYMCERTRHSVGGGWKRGGCITYTNTHFDILQGTK